MSTGTSAHTGHEDAVVVGKVSGLYGTRGWVKIRSHTRPRENILGYTVWLIGGAQHWLEYRVLAHRAQGRTLIANLENVTDRDAAARLIGLDIAVPRDQLPAPPPGEFYWRDLVGCSVVNLQGVLLGEVRGLAETGANDVMVVAGAREYLIPFVREIYVLDINPMRRLITVDWHVDD